MTRKLFGFILLAAAAAGAVTVTPWLAVNGSNQAVYMRQQEDGARWTWDILQAEAQAWRFAVGAEAEFDHPRKPVYETAGVPDPEGNELVQRYVRYRDDIFDARAGTFDKTLGKGLTLRSYDDRDFGVFQRLDGGLVDANVPVAGRSWGDVSALWGRNERDEEHQTRNDHVGGGQLTFRPFDFFYLTGSAARAKVENLTTAALEDEKLYGAGLGGTTKFVDLYGEYAERQGYNFAVFDNSWGRGFYGIATGYLPRSSVTVEYKNYADLSYPYNNPPPASYDQRMITGGEGASRGEWGYFAQGSTNPIADLRFTGGYSYADDKVGKELAKTYEIAEAFGTARYDFAFPVVVEAGYKSIGAVHYTPAGKTGDLRETPMLRVSWTPFPDHSFSAEVERENRHDYTSHHNYLDNTVSGAYTYSSWLGANVTYEDSTERVRELVDPGEPAGGILPIYRVKQNWLWGELRLSWYHHLLQNHVLTVGYGSQRGGLVCSSGVCRQQAPFTGIKVALESAF